MNIELEKLLERLKYELDGGHNEMDTCVALVHWYKKQLSDRRKLEEEPWR